MYRRLLLRNGWAPVRQTDAKEFGEPRQTTAEHPLQDVGRPLTRFRRESRLETILGGDNGGFKGGPGAVFRALEKPGIPKIDKSGLEPEDVVRRDPRDAERR